MRKILIAAGVVLLLAGCEKCEKVFADSQIVKHRVIDMKFVVVRSAETANLEGHCLIDLRASNGLLVSMDPNELIADQ